MDENKGRRETGSRQTEETVALIIWEREKEEIRGEREKRSSSKDRGKKRES